MTVSNKTAALVQPAVPPDRGERLGVNRKHDEASDRQSAYRAILISALGLAATGTVELLIALYTGSVALLGDALHNLGCFHLGHRLRWLSRLQAQAHPEVPLRLRPS
jgi:hypothetical protein